MVSMNTRTSIAVGFAALISGNALADCQSDWQEAVDRIAPYASTVAGKDISPRVVISSKWSNAHAWVNRQDLSRVWVNPDHSCDLTDEMREAIAYHELGHMVSFVMDPEIMSMSSKFPEGVMESIADHWAAKMAVLSGQYKVIVATFEAACITNSRACQHVGALTAKY